MSGHIDDEDAGYNGVRFWAIAANRGAEGVEKEIAEHRLNFAKCYTAFQYNFLCLATEDVKQQYCKYNRFHELTSCIPVYLQAGNRVPCI